MYGYLCGSMCGSHVNPSLGPHVDSCVDHSVDHSVDPCVDPHVGPCVDHSMDPCVDPSVCVQGGAGGEGLVAELTRVRSLPRVSPHVSLEQGGPVEHLATVGTGDRLLAQPGHPLRLLGLLGTWGGGGLVFAAGASVSSRGEGVGWGGEEDWEGRTA